MTMDSVRPDSYRRFYEEVGEKYPEEEIVYRTLKGRLRRAFVLKCLSSWTGRLLDVGCNRGMYLKAYKGGEKVGVDLSWHALKKIRDRGDDTPLAVADAGALDCFRDGVFDVVLCSEVLEHVVHPDRVLEGMHRLLVPGGHALVTTPNYRDGRPDWAEVGMMKAYGVHGMEGDRYYHTAFRPEELARMGEGVGFHAVEMGTLEKEIKYASKMPLVLFHLSNFLNRMTVQSPAWTVFNQRLYDGMMLGIYRLIKGIGLHSFFIRWISEGVRTYVIFEKPRS